MGMSNACLRQGVNCVTCSGYEDAASEAAAHINVAKRMLLHAKIERRHGRSTPNRDVSNEAQHTAM